MKKTLLIYTILLITLGIGELIFLSGCKKEPVIPSLTTSNVSDITINAASSGGIITSDGGADITSRGVCWGTSSQPTINEFHTTDNDKGVGPFTSSLTGLIPNTFYYVRAYATNNTGTGYGNEVSFRTNPIIVATLSTSTVVSITPTTAVSGGNITSDGGGSITARGVCWATTSNPTISNNLTNDGPGTGSFASNLTGLQPGTTYNVRAYATNSAGTAYGNELSFSASAITPSITTTTVSNITSTTATSGGNITSDGGAAITSRGVCWGIASNPSVTGSHTTNDTGVGNFTSDITGLTPNTLYYARAYATNSAGTAYGNEITFTSKPVVVPTLTTTSVTSITSSTAISGGNISYDGGSSITARGVCWAATANPTTANSKTTDASGTGSFTSNITGLLPGTLYHVRAYGTNSAGTAYGNDLSFTTAAILPTLTTTTVSGITRTTATSGGNISSNGGAAVTARGVCWGTSSGPIISGSHTTDGAGNGNFTSSLTGLTPNTIYYLRAYANNSVGTAYGNEVTFTSSPIVIATLTTTNPTSITENTAVSGGNITDDGGSAVTDRGVCWRTSDNPTIADAHTSNGSGTGSFTSNLTGLTAGTIYYVRAYATNSRGTAYGNQFKISTSIADVEGNVYKTVSIGTQLWMAENLKSTKYNNNTSIPNVTDNSEWSTLTTPAYCWYDNNITNKGIYGALYNWFTVNTSILCPTNWHVPTDTEFNTLELFLGMSPTVVNAWGWRGTDQGSQLKNTTGWDAGGNGTNTSGFSALPGGYRYAASGAFFTIGTLTYWWSSTADGTDAAWYRRLDGANSDVYKASTSMMGGKYIRCLKD